MKLSNNIYNILKWITLVVLPAIITFAGVVMNTLNFEYTNVVLTIATAFVTMLGSILGLSSYNYNKGKEEK